MINFEEWKKNFPKNLNLKCGEEYLQSVFEKAASLNLLENLTLRFSQLSEKSEKIIDVYSDFAPFSFYFVIPNFLNGGIIFHGSHDNGGNGDFPTLSVNVNPYNGWNIHT